MYFSSGSDYCKFWAEKKKQNKVLSQDYALWGFKKFPGNGCLTWRLPGVWCQCNPCIFALITLPLHNTCLTYSGNWTNLYEPNVKPQRQNIFTNLYFKVSLSRMNFCQGFVTRLRLSFALSSLGVFDPGFLIMALFLGWSVVSDQTKSTFVGQSSVLDHWSSFCIDLRLSFLSSTLVVIEFPPWSPRTPTRSSPRPPPSRRTRPTATQDFKTNLLHVEGVQVFKNLHVEDVGDDAVDLDRPDQAGEEKLFQQVRLHLIGIN